jgi:hypothetical protein
MGGYKNSGESYVEVLLDYKRSIRGGIRMDRCNADDILNIKINDIGTKKEIEQAKKDAETIRNYFKQFLPQSDTCHTCGKPLGGFLGTFTEGITYGTGHCSNCGHPVTFIHDVEDIATIRLVLQWPKEEE